MSQKEWRISVDTGGTFTDCLAEHISGHTLRLKVLSSGCIKGRLTGQAGNEFISDLKWDLDRDIFKGYEMHLDGITRKVYSFNPETNGFVLDAESVPLPATFTLTANEEAPLLASRIVTQTGLEESFPSIDFRLGTTKGTNALLEKKGSRTALITTKGFQDLPYIGTQQRPHLFQLNIPEPELLFDIVFEIDERIDSDGRVLQEIDVQQLLDIKKELLSHGVRTVAVALMNSYRNSIHEKDVRAILQADIPYISLSSILYAGIHLLPRMRTTLVNAYLHPIMDAYLSQIKTHIPELKVMSSSGGLTEVKDFHPKDGLLSGPAGGVLGAYQVAQQFGVEKVITLDMGGTSTDCARFDNGFDYAYSTKIGLQEVAVPTVDIETVAAGGGSICYFDGFKLNVGPESAGAHPGPACYGAGGPLTITDVNLLLGKMHKNAFNIPIDEEAAQTRLDHIIHQILESTTEKLTRNEVLLGFEKIANEKMASAIRKISVSKGFDPKEYTLMAFGGAGGMHICGIADILEIPEVLIPYDAGILSAKGIHNAEVEKWCSSQVLEEWNGMVPIRNLVKELEDEIKDTFKKDGYDEQQITIKNRLVYLRLLGQSNTLEVEFSENLKADFQSAYSNLFGYYPQQSTIEIESVKVIGATSTNQINSMDWAVRDKENVIDGNLFLWDDLMPAQILRGNAVLYNQLCTVHIPENWELIIQENKDVLLRKTHSSTQETITNETIELELFTNRFMAIADKTGLQLQRTSFSVNIKERLDFSCAILNPNAQLLANAPHIPVHLGSLGVCARLILEEFPLDKGDVIITNHPKYGGSHLPDITLISGAFDDDGQLIGYLINRAHHAEIGGKRPGSMPPDATSLVEEGVVIPPTYLAKSGRMNWLTIEKILTDASYPTRSLKENLADIRAALASLKVGAEDLRGMVRKFGLGKVHYYMQLLLDVSQRTLDKVLLQYEGQVLEAKEYMDGNHKIQVAIHVNKGRVVFDFEGASPVHPRNLNANPAIVNSVVVYVLRLLCNDDRIPLNEGLMQCVEIRLPDNSFLSPHFSNEAHECPAVVGGNTEVSQRLTDTLIKAFGLAACSQGTMNNFLFGNDSFGYYETIGGGTGAGNGFNGRSAVHQHMTNTKITDPEEMEFRYPVRLWQFGIRKHSGGDGEFRGGDGIIREVEFLEEMEMTILSQHRKQAPYGLSGGKDGKVGRQILRMKDGTIRELEHIDEVSVKQGDRIIIETPGGGGFGTSS